MTDLKDVAKLAGVSIATVSRVLNNIESVSPRTRKRVERAIQSLEYQPNRVAQRLRYRNARRQMIGLLIPDIQNPFYVEVIKGVEDVAYDNHYAVLMGDFSQDDTKEKMLLHIMRGEAIDGLIVAPARKDDLEVIKLVQSGLALVCVDRGLNNVNVDVVVVDNEKGAFDAVNLLIALGYKRIAYIGGLPQIPSTIERKNGYLNALKENGLMVDPELIRFGDSKHMSGKSITKELLEIHNPPTALFTGNNLITLGALETIHSQGLKIPSDIAIVGFDDMYWAVSLNPPLTAVKQPAYEIGKRAAELLFQRIKDPSRPPVKIVLSTTLNRRSSC